jgi:hypothetical protein
MDRGVSRGGNIDRWWVASTPATSDGRMSQAIQAGRVPAFPSMSASAIGRLLAAE